MSGLAYLAGGLLQGTGKGMQENAATRIEEEVAKAKAMQQENYAIKLNDMATQRDKVNNELADTRQKSQNDFTRQMTEDQNVWKAANDDKNYARDVAENDRAFQRSKSLVRPSEYQTVMAEAKKALDNGQISQEEYSAILKGSLGLKSGSSEKSTAKINEEEGYTTVYDPSTNQTTRSYTPEAADRVAKQKTQEWLDGFSWYEKPKASEVKKYEEDERNRIMGKEPLRPGPGQVVVRNPKTGETAVVNEKDLPQDILASTGQKSPTMGQGKQSSKGLLPSVAEQPAQKPPIQLTDVQKLVSDQSSPNLPPPPTSKTLDIADATEKFNSTKPDIGKDRAGYKKHFDKAAILEKINTDYRIGKLTKTEYNKKVDDLIAQ